MKHLVAVVSFVAVVFFSVLAVAADKVSIANHVDEIVSAIDGGKEAASFAPDAYTPYAFIMDSSGTLLVHPSLAGQDLKEKAMPIYEALQAATDKGQWITYEYNGNEKNTYAKKTASGLIVGSGY
ncbi:PDC sensor domain-containing protein [Desulfogranum japonicum]|uniref:hypothetical protein n=1 Tax=Desulfogranum japonicum TaxID=231447 RepID=UPI0003FB8ADC|nr:hypothetical protein [Desulfogranum japonicum]